jgi:hypothetical protein
LNFEHIKRLNSVGFHSEAKNLLKTCFQLKHCFDNQYLVVTFVWHIKKKKGEGEMRSGWWGCWLTLLTWVQWPVTHLNCWYVSGGGGGYVWSGWTWQGCLGCWLTLLTRGHDLTHLNYMSSSQLFVCSWT